MPWAHSAEASAAAPHPALATAKVGVRAANLCGARAQGDDLHYNASTGLIVATAGKCKAASMCVSDLGTALALHSCATATKWRAKLVLA